MSQKEIAAQVGCIPANIGYWLVKYQIPRREKLGSPRRPGLTRNMGVNISRETLVKMYHEEKLTAVEIAKELGCGESTVWKQIFEHGLQIDQEEQRQRKLARNAIRFADQRRMSGGYKHIKRADHPYADGNGYVREHRLAVEPLIGRTVNDEERVHHINFDKKDNAIENLAVLPNQSTHLNVHRYIERIGAYALGLINERPDPLVFEQQILWGGHYITTLDLLGKAEALGYIKKCPAAAQTATQVN